MRPAIMAVAPTLGSREHVLSEQLGLLDHEFRRPLFAVGRVLVSLEQCVDLDAELRLDGLTIAPVERGASSDRHHEFLGSS